MSPLGQLAYLVAALFFIFGLKRMARVRTSKQGNLLAAFGMLIAIVTTLADPAVMPGGKGLDWTWIVAGLVVGSAIGAIAAVRVQMTSMPEMVALFNGSGGIASLFVALAFYFALPGEALDGRTLSALLSPGSAASAPTLALSILVGGITFTGSVVAFAKLAGKMTSAPVLLPGRHALNLLLVVGALVLGALAVFVLEAPAGITIVLVLLTLVSFVLGVTLTIPIGGADMPVVISLLNSYSGIAASMTGFVIGSNVLIVCGALVGAAGLILTNIMCKAMNRSLANVLFGGFGVADSTGTSKGEGYKNVKEASPEDAAMLLEDAQSVVFVPGYGLAVAQAQHVCHQLAKLLESRGTKVLHAIHPVAGRMPGHMNVLLAEADVPYEQLVEMDDINPEFKNTDVVIVLGANDVVNPAALHDKTSPIYGMPILNVFEARTVFVVKRSLGAGFSGIKNELFENDNTMMVLGDAKKVLQKLIEELQDL